jgi:3-hydroxyisobutyrate dehydrogenase-like beta-hydroxyacid dehydrogenase
MKIGFIGLGIMGAPMALHLVDAGHQLYVHTVGRVPEASRPRPHRPARTPPKSPAMPR